MPLHDYYTTLMGPAGQNLSAWPGGFSVLTAINSVKGKIMALTLEVSVAP